MGVTKKNTTKRSSRLSAKKGNESQVTIVYKSKISQSSFPEKIKKVNKLLSKAKLIK
jgi:hypothetical protein